MSSIDTRQKLIYGDGALQKASLTYKNAQTGREVTLPVQFNPTEYSISRGLRFKNNAGHGEESHPENTQAADSDLIMKMNAENHEQSLVTFSWGSMAFYGHITSLSISYQMFNLNGMPVRAKLDMEIEGEDKSILNVIGANPHESPDRTKYRRLNQREELWMLADAEYHDVSCWKEIARENGILNPRKIDYTKRLKVPAL